MTREKETVRRLGRRGNSRTREVLHRVLYPNAHINGFKKKMKTAIFAICWHVLRCLYICVNLNGIYGGFPMENAKRSGDNGQSEGNLGRGDKR